MHKKRGVETVLRERGQETVVRSGAGDPVEELSVHALVLEAFSSKVVLVLT